MATGRTTLTTDQPNITSLPSSLATQQQNIALARKSAGGVRRRQKSAKVNVRRVLNATSFPDDYLCEKIYHDRYTRMRVINGEFDKIYQELYELINPPSLILYLQSRQSKFPVKSGTSPASVEGTIARMRFVDTARFWPVAAALAIQSWWRGVYDRRQVAAMRKQQPANQELKNALLMKRYFEYTDICLRIAKPTPSLKEYAAILIQTRYRAYIFRKFILPYMRRQKTVRISTVPDHSGFREQQTEACRRIQQWWRSQADRKAFQAYRDLIVVLSQTEAKELLKIVNPREAALCDESIEPTVHIRLGGKPIVDMNAFSPRQYAFERVVGKRLTGNWYQKRDWNQWRPLSNKRYENDKEYDGEAI